MGSLDHGFKIVAQASPTGLARLGGLPRAILKPVESTVQTTTERLADRAFLVRHKREPFVLYMEFVASWKEAVLWSILEKSGTLAKRERLPVMSLVFVLRPKGYRNQNGTMRLSALGQPTQQVWFRDVCLWEIEPEDWWDEEPGLMAIYPLCRHQKSGQESIQHSAGQIEAHERDSAKRADLLTTLGIFGRLAYPGLDALSLIGREKMRESKAYLEILEEGEINRARRDLLGIIAKRFGTQARNSSRAAVNAIDDGERLFNLLLLASTAESIDEIKHALN